jgi:hypothetical protein
VTIKFAVRPSSAELGLNVTRITEAEAAVPRGLHDANVMNVRALGQSASLEVTSGVLFSTIKCWPPHNNQNHKCKQYL